MPHYLYNKKIVTRFRLAALLLLLNRLLIPASLGLLVYSLLLEARDLAHLSLGLVALSVFIAISQSITASRVRCPLCIGFPLSISSCVKNASARKFLGSYRLRVACTVIFKGNFRCPYCGESTLIDVRKHHRKSP